VLGIAAIPPVTLRVLSADLRSPVGPLVVVTTVLLAAALGHRRPCSPRLRGTAALRLAGGGLNAVVVLANGGMPVFGERPSVSTAVCRSVTETTRPATPCSTSARGWPSWPTSSSSGSARS